MSEHTNPVAALAYELWVARGRPDGSAEQDWLEAERLLGKASPGRATSEEDKLERSLAETFPASDPPATRAVDEPPSNADAKWKAANRKRKPPPS